MNKKLTTLVQKINYFCKLAGELKIPDKVLKEACDYIKASFCRKFAEKLGPQLLANRKRIKTSQEIDTLSTQWSDMYHILDDARLSETEDEKLFWVEKIIKFLNKAGYNLSFPRFDAYSLDPVTNLNGIIDDRGISILIGIDKNDNGSYYLMLDIRFKAKLSFDEEPTTIKVDVFEPETDIDTVIQTIKDNFQSISTVVGAINDLRNSMEIHDNKYLSHLNVVYQECLKNIKKVPEEDFRYRSSKMISFTSKDLPGIKTTNEKEYSIDIQLISSEESKAKTEGYEGLWRAYNDEYGYLGKAYVVANFEKSFQEIQSIPLLHQELNRLCDITRHEVQHSMQDFIKKVKDLKEEGGLPGKRLRDPRFEPSGVPVGDKSIIPPNLVDEKDRWGRIQHGLRDVEFYTRISDEIYEFNRVKTNLPLSLHRDLMLAWIDHISYEEFQKRLQNTLKAMAFQQAGLDPKDYISHSLADRFIRSYNYRVQPAIEAMWTHRHFFVNLKEEQHLKYQKAASEFVKGVGL